MSSSIASLRAQAPHDLPVPSRSNRVGAAAGACLSAKDIAALSKAREARWRPGRNDQPLHSEIFAGTQDASGVGLALALACDALRTEARLAAEAQDPLIEVEDRRHILWVQETRAIQRSGRPYLHGLPKDLRERLIHVEAQTPEDALFALEEGLKCRDLACVIGEIVGNPRALDFTASRRLSLAAERHHVALWLVRLEGEADLSSARMRWRVEPVPSQEPNWNADAPGRPSWKADLFRARSHAPGQWIVCDDETTLRAERPESGNAARQRLGPALARKRRFWHPGGGLASQLEASAPPNTRHLVRATVGRSLASCTRL
ncbi:MAG: recA-like protein [Pseudomonadota bacterium]